MSQNPQSSTRNEAPTVECPTISEIVSRLSELVESWRTYEQNRSRQLSGMQRARTSDKSDLLRAGKLWTQAVAQAQEAKKLSDELLSKELETWMKE